MTAKPSRKQESRATTMVPVTTMEELLVLSDEEREKLLADLRTAEAEAAAGQSVEFDPEAFERVARRAQ
ncbi:MAG: hypothetical protein AB7V13_29145 [Pseudorhodoplanes sp.]|uniref:hypothetical protein n=1 Tax=Pseudorhodoplanes sp. TaxID=1934341 RepID=UPI003D14B578